MRHLPVFAIIIFAFFAQSCVTHYSVDPFAMFEPVPEGQPIHAVEQEAELPADAVEIGNFKLKQDLGEGECDYDVVMNTGKALARKMGANVMLIQSVEEPTDDRCYHIKGLLYKGTVDNRISSTVH